MYEAVETRVEIFGSNSCAFCQQAKALCEEKGLPFVYRNIDEEEEYFDQLVGRIISWKTVPQIFIGANHIGGFKEFQEHLK